MKQKAAHAQSTPLVRASISFPPNLYEALEEIAKQKRCHWHGLCVTRPKDISPAKLNRPGKSTRRPRTLLAN
jgi:hypothetical protein